MKLVFFQQSLKSYPYFDEDGYSLSVDVPRLGQVGCYDEGTAVAAAAVRSRHLNVDRICVKGLFFIEPLQQCAFFVPSVRGIMLRS